MKKNLGVQELGKRWKRFQMCTSHVSTIEIEIKVKDERNYTSLEAYTAYRLISIDKKPGVRPIGVGEVLRRIVGKAIISVIKPEIMSCAGNLQLCAGQASGCKTAVHAISVTFLKNSLLMHCC